MIWLIPHCPKTIKSIIKKQDCSCNKNPESFFFSSKYIKPNNYREMSLFSRMEHNY